MAIDGGAEDPVFGGGDHAGSATSLAMLLVPSHLPGPGWEVSRERTWPTGQLDPESEKSRRAVEAGAITAWRSFEQAAAVA